jgi:iron complex transport system ATP-binding protein
MRGVLPQASAISFPFTVREIVRMGLTSGLNRNPEKAEQTAAKALASVDLGGYEGRFYQHLSGGEQQRVQLARVLCQISDPSSMARRAGCCSTSRSPASTSATS